MAKNEKISLGENVSVPVHVGVIMDGNGRGACPESSDTERAQRPFVP